MPHALADVIRRRNSSRRASSRATSIPPHVVFTPSSVYWRWLSSVSSAISLLWSVVKMKLDAWPVEPPGLGRGPLSTRTRSVHPNRARCPTRQLPTMPAPITTHLADRDPLTAGDIAPLDEADGRFVYWNSTTSWNATLRGGLSCQFRPPSRTSTSPAARR